jgi:hypothetical protein
VEDDPELEALLAVLRALQPLSTSARERAVGYVVQRLRESELPVCKEGGGSRCVPGTDPDGDDYRRCVWCHRNLEGKGN